MSRTRSSRPKQSTNTFASQAYRNYMERDVNSYELAIDGKLDAPQNLSYLSPDNHSGYTHIQINSQDGANRKDKRIKSHRKRTHADPENTMVIKQVDEYKGFSLEIPEAAKKIRSEPQNERQSTGNYSNYQQAQTPIKPIFQIDLGSYDDDSPEPALKANKASRYDETKSTIKTSQNVKSSKSKGNSNVVMLNLSSSTEERKLQAHGRHLSKDAIISHESSDVILENGSQMINVSYGPILQPIPQGENRQFSYKRQQLCCSSLSNPQFSLYLNGGGFLFNAKKQFGHINSTYLISATEGRYESKGQSYLGYLKGNFTGSQFNLFQEKDGSHQVVATIAYDSGWKCCSSNFRKMEVYVKNPSFRGSFGDNVSLKELYESVGDNSSRNIIKLITKEPKYQPKRDCYILNFKGKSKYGSIKNMILIEPSKSSDYIMMFCKNDAHEFHLEVSHPLSPLIAFGVVLSGFDFKLCCQ